VNASTRESVVLQVVLRAVVQVVVQVVLRAVVQAEHTTCRTLVARWDVRA
jgi:hypothetical protein